MQIARIDQNTGAVLLDTLIYPGPGMTPEDAAEFMEWESGTWRTVPPEDAAELQKPSLAEAREMKLAEVMRGYAAVFAEVEKIYPPHEREGWAIQEAEAMTLMSDPSANTPVLSALVQLRGKNETVAELAVKVMENAQTWRAFYAYYTGQQQRLYAEVNALATVDAVLAYEVVYQPLPTQ